MRNATAQKSPADDRVMQEIGEVAAVNDGRFTISCSESSFHAQRAVSCLVEPQVGDRVLFAGKVSGDLYVLAVLARESNEVVVKVPGDLTLSVGGGRFAVAAHSVDLVSSQQIGLASTSLEVRAARSKFFLRTAELVADAVVGEATSLKTIVGRLEQVAEQAIERVKRSYRFVSEAEHVRAGSYDLVANDTMRLRGEHAFVQAEKLVKIDGEQIHLG